MWPKAIAQLIELAPHVARMLPMADRFFQNKSAEQEATRAAMEQVAQGLRGDLGQVTASHVGLYRQLNDQSEKLSAMSAELHSTLLVAEDARARIMTLEHQAKVLRMLVGVSLSLSIATVGLLILLMVRR